MDRQELLARMQVEQKRFLEGVWEKRQPDLPISTPQEALTLASIVEKETGRADERERVAAVFVNRLNKKMRLQSDPTIIYGIAGGQGSLGRPITRTDIDTKTDYNTYRINGLPPGPICNPGRDAIAAVLNPAKTTDLYFVADGAGGHTFSETLAEHNSAVQNWRKIEREQKADDDKDGDNPPAAMPVVMNADASAGSVAAAEAPAPPEAEGGSPPRQPSNIPLPIRKPKAP
jgi:UPF0755 protein